MRMSYTLCWDLKTLFAKICVFLHWKSLFGPCLLFSEKVRRIFLLVGMKKILRGFTWLFQRTCIFSFSSVAFWLLPYLLRSCKIKRCWAQILQRSVPRNRIQIPHIFCDLLQNIANGISFVSPPNYRKLGKSRFMLINWKSFMVKLWFWNWTF